MVLAIVIVPASFTPPEIYSDLETALHNVGFQSRIVDLPSVGTRESGKKPGTMSDDAAEIAKVVNQVYANEPDVEEVVLLAHSYGGIPASESMKLISVKNAKATGTNAGVSRIIYLAAIVLPVGLSNDEMRKRPIPDYVVVDEDWITIDHSIDAQYAHNDLSVEEGLIWSAKMQQQSTASFRERATYAGYNDVEVHYVICTDDQTLPLQGTKRILAVIEESSGKLPKRCEFASGHNPMVSKPKELALFVKEHVLV